MTKEEFLNSAYDLIYLSRCAVNGTVPDKERAEAMNEDMLFFAAGKHMMISAAAAGALPVLLQGSCPQPSWWQ